MAVVASWQFFMAWSLQVSLRWCGSIARARLDSTTLCWQFCCSRLVSPLPTPMICIAKAHDLVFAAETASWFATFKMLNESGQPACCPYSAMIILSTFLRIVAGMVARIATTLICLGYGIVRPQISWPEVFVVSGLGVCYFIAVGALEISHISNQSDGEVQPPAVWEALVITTNSCFIGWIFTSLALTRRNLAAFGQVRLNAR